MVVVTYFSVFFRNHIKVDVFGVCGRKKCGKNSQCESMLTNDYKFYLAFENSVCQDYTTEKFFDKLAKFLIVPIVLSRAVISNLAPKHSYIAADDFKSPQDLAAYLNYLDTNTTAYLKYFSWWDQLRIINRPLWMCDLCMKLWSEAFQKTSVYKNVVHWYHDKTKCSDGFARNLLKQALL